MNQLMLKKEVLRLEAEIKLLKLNVSKEPDFKVDEKNWTKVKPSAKKIRSKLFKKIYG